MRVTCWPPDSLKRTDLRAIVGVGNYIRVSGATIANVCYNFVLMQLIYSIYTAVQIGLEAELRVSSHKAT